MPESYDLTKLDAHAFEALVNTLALHLLGAGHTGFGPGADAGRDGYFEGEAPYPSAIDKWKGSWYIQSKFHKPHLSKDAQQWLIEQIKAEIAQFEQEDTDRYSGPLCQDTDGTIFKLDFSPFRLSSWLVVK